MDDEFDFMKTSPQDIIAAVTDKLDENNLDSVGIDDDLQFMEDEYAILREQSRRQIKLNTGSPYPLKAFKASSEEIVEVKNNSQQNSSNGTADTPVMSSSVLEEQQTMLFEDILHPEMIEAIESLQQLDFEESEMINQLKSMLVKVVKGERFNRDHLQALNMELLLRRKEKVKTLEILRSIEDERTDNTKSVIKEVQKLREQNDELSKILNRRNRRQEGNFTYKDVMDVYDWVVDISLLGDLNKDGWQVIFSSKFFDKLQSDGALERNTLGYDDTPSAITDWAGAVIAVVGLYDKGKTFVLNQITQSNLPSGKKCTTKGLSFKHVNVESTNFVLLDSAGSYSPVKVVDELSVAEKEATELFLLDLIFDLSDYFICVVNDFTSLDQRYLDKLTRGLQNSNKMFREVIVIHNLKEVTSYEVLAHVWETQVTQIYSGGSRMSTQVAAVNPKSGKLEEKHVEWFKTKYSRHICLAHHDSEVGQDINPWTVSLLRYWLKSVFVPVDRQFSVVNEVVRYSGKKLSTYFKETVNLEVCDGPSDHIKYIRPVGNGDLGKDKNGMFRLPQVALDASGLMLTRPDSFIPPVDVFIESGEYVIYMDVPGLSDKDITLHRQNVTTIVKGQRKAPNVARDVVEKRQERKYGDFTMPFTIPHEFERKWYSQDVVNGVLTIRFKRDHDDAPMTGDAWNKFVENDPVLGDLDV